MRKLGVGIYFDNDEFQAGITKSTKSLGTLGRASNLTAEDIKKLNTDLKKYGIQLGEVDNSQKLLVREAKAQARELDRTRKKVNQVTAEYEQMTKAIDMDADAQQRYNAVMRLGSKATDEQKKQVDDLVLAYQKARNEANKTQGSFRGLRGQAQNLGWQVQDVAVQWQAGTDAMVIFSQQGSQIASGFGPKGAVVGAVLAVAGAVAGALVPSLFDADDALEDFEEAMEDVNDVIDTSIGKNVEYSESIRGLAKQYIGLAKIELQYAKLQAEKAIEKMRGSVAKLNKELGIYRRESRARATEQVRYNKSIEDLANKFGITTTEAKAFVKATEDFGKGGSVESFVASMTKLSETYNGSNEELTKILKTTSDYAQGVITSEAAIKSLQKTLEEGVLPKEVEDPEEKRKSQQKLFEKYASLELQAAIKLKKDIAAIEELAASDLMVSDEYLNNARTEAALNFNETIAEITQARVDKQAEIEEEARRESLGSWGRYWEDMAEGMDAAATAQDEVSKGINTLSGELTQAVTGAQSFGDALANAFNQILRSAINALIQYYIQKLIISQLTAGQDATKAGAYVTSVAARGAAESALAGVNAFASTAAIPVVGPPAAPAAAAAAVEATGALTSTAVTAASNLVGAAAAGGLSFHDKGGVIPQGQYGIVSEYGDELVNGVMVKGKEGGTRVTSREDTAKMMGASGGAGGGQTIIQNISISGAGDKALTVALEKAARKGAKDGASMGYAMVSKDFKNGTGIRKQLKRSAGV